MAKIEKIGEYKWQYFCECGAELKIETDGEPLKKLVRCWKCQKPFDKDFEKDL